MNYLTIFKQWLRLKKYNPNTIRNYLADIRKYVHFVQNLSKPQDLFSSSTLQSYMIFVKDKKNFRRYLTSLSKYFQFALAQNLITENPFKTTRKQVLKHRNTNYESFLQLYQSNLIRLHKTPVTIKNYINDVQQFFDVFNSQSVSFDQIFTPEIMEQYSIYLKNTHRSLSSIKRKLSSLSSFYNFLRRRKFISSPQTPKSPLSKGDLEGLNNLRSDKLTSDIPKNKVTRFLSHFIRNDISKMAK